jgi:hypothetical protein
MAGIGGFDQTGRIGSSLKSLGLLTYGGGQLAPEELVGQVFKKDLILFLMLVFLVV